jgi:valyl-tRNA synthetase
MEIKDMKYINTPPPTISGNLHIGHIFSYTHIDTIARAQKYLGNKIYFPIGFDCNGLPTENLLRKSDKPIDEYCENYLKLFKKMGFQMDFDNYYKTIDFNVLPIFNELKNRGLIYKATKEVWFDTALNTPLSNSEVIEKNGNMIGEVSKKLVIKKETEQYFLKTVEFKERLLELANKIEFYPPKMKTKLIIWIENLNQDWCITRDREFGIKIENKVFDTWFISALTYCRFNKQSDYHFQSHEIIRSWCFYSLVMSMHLNNDMPFKKVFISGWCLAKDGEKFSKSSSNGLDPLKLIEKYGINPIRFWACKVNWGTDAYFDENVVLNGRKLIIKLENAQRFFELKNAIQIDIDFIDNVFISLLKNYDISGSLNHLYKEFFLFCGKDIEECKTANQDFINQKYSILLSYKKAFDIFINS